MVDIRRRKVPEVHCLEEMQRTQVVLGQRGPKDTLPWAKQTLHIYRRALADKGDVNRRPHFARSREYRSKFLASIIYLHLYIKRWTSHG